MYKMRRGGYGGDGSSLFHYQSIALFTINNQSFANRDFRFHLSINSSSNLAFLDITIPAYSPFIAKNRVRRQPWASCKARSLLLQSVQVVDSHKRRVIHALKGHRPRKEPTRQAHPKRDYLACDCGDCIPATALLDSFR